MKHYDVIIVGAGSIGMSAGYFLSKEGKRVLLLDAHDPPHTMGSHGGETRLIRHAYGEGRAYTPLALKSQQLWDDLQEQTELPIFQKTGVLSFGPVDTPFLKEALESAKAHHLQAEKLTEAEMKRRWAGLQFPEEGPYIGCYEPDAGVLFVENCIQTYRELALQEGAELLTETPVKDVTMRDEQVSIQTSKTSYIADDVIICAGAWNRMLLQGVDLMLPLQPKRQVVGWFEANDQLFGSCEGFPGFSAHTPSGIFYGFPSIDGSGVKVGCHDFGQVTEPDEMVREFGVYDEDEAVLSQFLKTWMPEAGGHLKKGLTCLYTMTPDEHFIIDTHPNNNRILIAAGFSGHGFKFASGIGHELTQHILKGKTEIDLSLFKLNRQALTT
ncbi:N-methyl-L-tryptophan oxidase [Salipaludibacillus agaradhaerens]|uniref:N-methyl-L-tryptophan oxidase n=1 Tax=Salipaludibacillus agaradhaerens TaxID=76935 RepID=UPI0009979084|nr:N-methyl-L-tryptophan oxidase [Salipaludibacillus agaradhaerens]